MRLIHGFRSQALIRLFVTLALLVTVGAQFLQATTPVRDEQCGFARCSPPSTWYFKLAWQRRFRRFY